MLLFPVKKSLLELVQLAERDKAEAISVARRLIVPLHDGDHPNPWQAQNRIKDKDYKDYFTYAPHHERINFPVKSAFVFDVSGEISDALIASGGLKPISGIPTSS